jgi:UDP:flavonoid glycosyltransferase YjiC (YdhE family)
MFMDQALSFCTAATAPPINHRGRAAKMSKRILFCWELGEGKGHVYPYLSLLEALQKDGHKISVAARDTSEVGSGILDRGFTLFQAPVTIRHFIGLDKVSFTYTEILLHFGYAHAPTLIAHMAAWRSLIESEEPALVISNGAPTASITARKLNVPTLSIGSGFDCPPPIDPSGLLRPWIPHVDERQRQSDDMVLTTLNSALAASGWNSVSSIADLYRPTRTLLCTFPELDHFGARPVLPEYVGLLPGAKAAEATNSDADRCEIFAYVKPGPHLDRVLSALRKTKRSVIVHCPELSTTDCARWSSTLMKCTARPVEVAHIMESCRLVVNNATHGLTAEALRAGKPLLMLPQHQEQNLVAMRVRDLGAGIVFQTNDANPKFGKALGDLFENNSFSAAAETFKDCYVDWTPERALDRARTICAGLLNESGEVVSRVSIAA